MKWSLFLLCVLFSSTVLAQTPPAAEKMETGPQIYYSGDFQILVQPDSCGASACFYTITVYNGQGQKVAQFLNTYGTVKTLSPTCWELSQTDDFMGLLDVPKYLGPFTPIALCLRPDGSYTEATAKMLQSEILSRRDELISQTKACRASKSCMNNTEDKAKIAELAVYKVLMERDNIRFNLPSDWLGGMDDNTYKALVTDIKAANFRRLGSHVLLP